MPPQKKAAANPPVYEGPPKVDLPDETPWPAGWTETHYERQGGASKGFIDRYWLDKDGKKYRSIKEVWRALGGSPKKAAPAAPLRRKKRRETATAPPAKAAVPRKKAARQKATVAVPPKVTRKKTKKASTFHCPPVTALPGGVAYPDGWTEQHVPRPEGGNTDKYWLVPKDDAANGSKNDQKHYKLRSVPQVLRFLAAYEQTNNAAAAYAASTSGCGTPIPKRTAAVTV